MPSLLFGGSVKIFSIHLRKVLLVVRFHLIQTQPVGLVQLWHLCQHTSVVPTIEINK